VAAGYVADAAGPSSLTGGTLRSGDAGFLWEGQLYVLGRLGDSMKVRGRTVFAEDLEAALGSAGVPPLRAAALLGERDGRPTVVAMFEQAQPDWLATAARLLGQRTEGADVVVVDAPRGAIARTSSGKPKRRRMWTEYLEDRLPGTVVTHALQEVCDD
jgi:acyl-CoA synthetase (AMP-forming)/AMP-acid ligase II